MFIYAASAVDQPKNGGQVGTPALPLYDRWLRTGTRRKPTTIRITGAAEEGQFIKIAAIVEDPTVRDQMIRSGDAATSDCRLTRCSTA
jgi:hypothetical protein